MVTAADRIAVEELKKHSRITIQFGNIRITVKDKICVHSIALSIQRYLDREECRGLTPPRKNRRNIDDTFNLNK